MDKEELLIKHIERIADETAKDNNATRQSMRDMEARIGENIDKMIERSKETEDRTEKRVDALLGEVNRQVDKIDNLKWWILGVCVTTILGIAAIIIAILPVVAQR